MFNLLMMIKRGGYFLYLIAPKVATIASAVVTLSSAVAAITPRHDGNGNPSQVHEYLDVFALNVLNSSHDMGLAKEIAPSDSDEIIVP